MMTVDQMIEVLTAWKAGKKIQIHQCGEWVDCAPHHPKWNFFTYYYRVKPEPKVIWVNEHKNGVCFVHESKEKAELYDGDAARVAVRYVESPEE